MSSTWHPWQHSNIEEIEKPLSDILRFIDIFLERQTKSSTSKCYPEFSGTQTELRREMIRYQKQILGICNKLLRFRSIEYSFIRCDTAQANPYYEETIYTSRLVAKALDILGDTGEGNPVLRKIRLIIQHYQPLETYLKFNKFMGQRKDEYNSTMPFHTFINVFKSSVAIKTAREINECFPLWDLPKNTKIDRDDEQKYIAEMTHSLNRASESLRTFLTEIQKVHELVVGSEKEHVL